MDKPMTAPEALGAAVSQRMAARKALVTNALVAFSKNPGLIDSFRLGQKPTWPELAPLTRDERGIVFGLIANTLNGEPNVD